MKKIFFLTFLAVCLPFQHVFGFEVLQLYDPKKAECPVSTLNQNTNRTAIDVENSTSYALKVLFAVSTQNHRNTDADLTECVKQEIQKFFDSFKDIREIRLIGFTSATGTEKTNINIATNRINIIKTHIQQIQPDIIIDTSNENTDSKYHEMVAGRSNAQSWSKNGKHKEIPEDRAVVILPVQDHISSICRDPNFQAIINGETANKLIETYNFTSIQKVRDACAQGLKNDDMIEMLDQLMHDITNTTIVDELQPIYKIYKVLYEIDDSINSWNWKPSVWKTADGSFNTARLASDLTAGVVLGTVGGVVSGVLIKKNQLKHGYESLRCTLGGQNIADWGDEFSVRFSR